MTEETVATHVTSGQCLTICLLTQFTAAALQDLSLVSGHLVSSQLRWHCSVVTPIVPAARPCHRKTNGDSSRVRAVTTTTTSRQISCSHSLCARMTRLLPSHSHGPISYLPGEPPTLPDTSWGRIWSLHHYTGAHLHTAYSKYIQTLIQNLYDT